jgi:TetR/AcrR family transcriptional regulator, repressor of fatR-cypB operon
MNEDTSEPKLPRKELERLRRRNDILKAARELFLTKGFVNATLEEVAQLAEFGKGTIYNYFANKEELLWGMIEQFLEENIALARRELLNGQGTARDKFRAYAEAVILSGREHEFFHMIMKEEHILEADDSKDRLRVLSDKIRTIWEIIGQVISSEIKAGRFRKGDSLQMAALFDLMVRTFGVGTLKEEFPIKNLSHEKTVDLIVTTFFDGVEINSAKGQ